MAEVVRIVEMVVEIVRRNLIESLVVLVGHIAGMGEQS